MKLKYQYTNEIHNLEAPKRIVPVVLRLFRPSSVIDVGCGTGSFLKVFKENGITDIVGVDGIWGDGQLRGENLTTNEFIVMDLEEPIDLNRKFDLVLCLEVAEHLSEQRANSFIEDLCNLGDVILFSAAIPGQGGINHLNEQWSGYWTDKFKKNGFFNTDILKPIFWEVKEIWWWYRQNMTIYIRNGKNSLLSEKLIPQQLSDVIHPEHYSAKVLLLNKIVNGEERVLYYFKLLVKSIFRKAGIIKKG